MTRITEPLAPGLTRQWTLREVIYSGHTAYQRLTIAHTSQGITLFSDDDRQSSELSQLVYHEALMVPGLLLAAARDRVLIIGSSEGVASQIAIAAGAALVDHVDIDRECVELCAEHLPYGYNPQELRVAVDGVGPVRVHYSDGFAFIAERAVAAERYDVIVIDLPDEVLGGSAQHNRLYGIDFLARCRELLTPGGVVITQAGCPTLWRQETLATALDRYRTVFPSTAFYGSWEHEWGFLVGCAEEIDDATTVMVRRLAHLPYTPQSIDAQSLISGSVLPYHLRDHSGARPGSSRLESIV